MSFRRTPAAVTAILTTTCSMGLLPSRVLAGFSAYNDLGGKSSGNVTAIGLGASGLLKDHATGADTGVTLQVSGTDMGEDASRVVADFAGGDAATEFGGVVNNDGAIQYKSASARARATFRFKGLNPAMLYTVVVTGARGNDAYSKRTARFSIADVDAFTNASSAGAPYSGDDWVEFNTGGNTTAQTGYVARFTNVQPGCDGDMKILAEPGRHNGDGGKWYVSMVKLVEVGPISTLKICPSSIDSTEGGADVKLMVAIPPGSNAGRDVHLTLTSGAPEVADLVGGSNGAQVLTFRADGDPTQSTAVDIGRAGRTSIECTNDAGLPNVTLAVNVVPPAATFNLADVTAVEGTTVPVWIAITPGSNDTRSIRMKLSTDDAKVAIPVIASGNSRVVEFPTGGATEKRIDIRMGASGNASISTTNEAGLGNASLAITVGSGFTFTSTTDPRIRVENWDKLLAGINEYVGGPGMFHMSAGDIDPPQPLREKIDAHFGPDFPWIPGPGNHEVETPEDMAWIRAEYHSGNGSRKPLKHLTNQDGPATCAETTFSWDYRNVHFVSLNVYWDGNSDTGTDGDVVPPLLDWLTGNLEASNRPMTIIFGHEPAFPFVRHTGDSLDKYPANRDAFWNLLESRGVAAYICGHTHLYKRYQKTPNKTWQIDLGNAGNSSSSHPEAHTFLNTIVTDTMVRFDIWQSEEVGSSRFRRIETWSVPITAR